MQLILGQVTGFLVKSIIIQRSIVRCVITNVKAKFESSSINCKHFVLTLWQFSKDCLKNSCRSDNFEKDFSSIYRRKFLKASQDTYNTIFERFSLNAK